MPKTPVKMCGVCNFIQGVAMDTNFDARSLYWTFLPLAECHTTGSRKAAQTIAFYGNSEQVEVLPLSGAHCSALALSSGHKIKCRTNRKREVWRCSGSRVYWALLLCCSIICFPLFVVQPWMMKLPHWLLTTDLVCARLDSLEMMLPVLSSHPLWVAQDTRYGLFIYLFF